MILKMQFQFNKIINGNDFVAAQNATLSFGRIYLDKKQQALNALKSF
jgi:hypothetical protein